MNATYRFVFEESVSLDDVELTLHLSKYAAEAFLSPAQISMFLVNHRDDAERTFEISGPVEVASVVASLLTSLLLREIGEHAFRGRQAHGARQEELAGCVP